MHPYIAVRPLRDEDTDDIVALYDRANTVEPGIGPVPRVAWQRFVKQPQNLNGRDFRVALRDRCVVGLAETSLKHQGEHVVRFCKLVVDPACRRQGIATALLADLVKIDQPGGIFNGTPVNTKAYADDMQRAGIIKPKAESWKDYFFPDIHDRKGS